MVINPNPLQAKNYILEYYYSVGRTDVTEWNTDFWLVNLAVPSYPSAWMIAFGVNGGADKIKVFHKLNVEINLFVKYVINNHILQPWLKTKSLNLSRIIEKRQIFQHSIDTQW